MDRRRLAGPEPTVQPILSPELRPGQDILDANLAREDGRYPEQMRPASSAPRAPLRSNRCLVIKKGIISKANGSAYIELGCTKLTCAVYGPRSQSGRVAGSKAYNLNGNLNCEIEFLPFSSFNRRPYQRDADEAELSAVLEASLEPAIRRDLFPNAFLDIFVTVLEDDGSVLAAAILAASAALAQAQVEMYDSVVACSALIVDSTVIVDPTKQESSVKKPGKSHMTCAVMPNHNRVTQVHSVGPMSASLYQETVNMVLDGSRALYQDSLKPVLLQK